VNQAERHKFLRWPPWLLDLRAEATIWSNLSLSQPATMICVYNLKPQNNFVAMKEEQTYTIRDYR
jgi:hypothetical protein